MKTHIRLLFCLGVLLTSCSSAKMLHTYKSPDRVMLHANKVLLVGLMPDEKAQQEFEEELKRRLSLDSVVSFRSIDLFDVGFTKGEYSEQELDKYEQQLLDKDFDAILFTKIIGSENRENFLHSLDQMVYSFRDDYQIHSRMYRDQPVKTYRVYHVETALYCICVDKERELAWRGVVQLKDPFNQAKTREDYIRMLVEELRKEQLLLGIGF